MSARLGVFLLEGSVLSFFGPTAHPLPPPTTISPPTNPFPPHPNKSLPGRDKKNVVTPSSAVDRTRVDYVPEEEKKRLMENPRPNATLPDDEAVFCAAVMPLCTGTWSGPFEVIQGMRSSLGRKKPRVLSVAEQSRVSKMSIDRSSPCRGPLGQATLLAASIEGDLVPGSNRFTSPPG
ncbi:hypothetical protein L249_8278 [Ophiocordyceps polyrhachis-furcata BCC 54312]|uniref:Uncharacterized protein n=1 Tax=Ophiocordyceps polyrhachis-furcata BCC 54312 TaxID=1330021 RepID=A0A367LI58_9HYPO|nr:hypothetical protein L249_8278 [Ophiocordyceps polyrhachis-furcata BCC 54312]